MVIFLSNKDVSSRVLQAGEKLGIVFISSLHHLCCALLPGSTEPLGESGVIDLRLPFSALGILQCRLLNVLGRCQSVQSGGGNRLFSTPSAASLLQPCLRSHLWCSVGKLRINTYTWEPVFPLLWVRVFHSVFLINQLYSVPHCIPLLCTWCHLFVLVWTHLIYPDWYLGGYIIRKIRIFILGFDF